MTISKEDVLHVAKLARLRLSENEVAIYAKQLSDILTHVEKLSTLETKAVAPTATVQDLRNVLRKDVADRAFDQQQVLQNSPDGQEGKFRVPSALDEGGSA